MLDAALVLVVVVFLVLCGLLVRGFESVMGGRR